MSKIANMMMVGHAAEILDAATGCHLALVRLDKRGCYTDKGGPRFATGKLAAEAWCVRNGYTLDAPQFR